MARTCAILSTTKKKHPKYYSNRDMGHRMIQLNVKNHRSIYILILAVLAMQLSSCGDSAFYDPDQTCTDTDPFGENTDCLPPPIIITPPPLCNGNDAGVVDGCGEAITAVDIYDPVTINLTGLTADTVHTIEVSDPSAAVIDPLAGGYSVSSDKDGNIYMATVVQNNVLTSGAGTYSVTVKEAGTAVQTLTYDVEDLSRVYCSDVAGTLKSSFASGANVYANIEKSGGTLADGDYDLYVVSDQPTPIPNGATIPGAATSISVVGGTVIADLGRSFTSGHYDVVVDIDGNGKYDRDTDLFSRHSRNNPCFTIQAANSDAPQQIASDRRGNNREIFDPDADIADIRGINSFLVPTEISAAPNTDYSDVYLVAHQGTWADDDPLIDVSTGIERTPVQDENNSQATWLLWGYSNLTTGCYDIVIDSNRDGLYTSGTDYVDNINHLGDTTDCGVRVSTPGCTNTTITSHTDGFETTSTALTLEGLITPPSGETTAASNVVISAGSQSNTINLDKGTTSYSALLPLYAGDNHLTVSGVFSDNTSCSETITITSLTDLALFRAQLTWDGDTDMDLHVVRPGGAYSNGGGGDDDCNYSNCNVGLDGTGINFIDWGEVDNENDDPKLDVDCIACGNGIENIWMNNISEDGVYTVYVDAFGGSETDVTVSLYILGSAVGQINCGSMIAGTATDSCKVGTITWRGGNSGGGYFTPIGTLANDF